MKKRSQFDKELFQLFSCQYNRLVRLHSYKQYLSFCCNFLRCNIYNQRSQTPDFIFIKIRSEVLEKKCCRFKFTTRTINTADKMAVYTRIKRQQPRCINFIIIPSDEQGEVDQKRGCIQILPKYTSHKMSDPLPLLKNLLKRVVGVLSIIGIV